MNVELLNWSEVHWREMKFSERIHGNSRVVDYY